MLKSYFKIACRNLLKNRAYAGINIGGLAIGMAVAMLIGLWIYDELSFNTYHQHYDRIASVLRQETWYGQTETQENNAQPLCRQLRSSFPGYFRHVVMASHTRTQVISSGDKKFTQSGNYMQPEAPDMLTLKMLKGSREGLRDLNSILLTASLAKKLFGEADPLNKMVRIDNKLDVRVTGVYEDLPQNSDFGKLTFIAPWDLFAATNEGAIRYRDDWNSNSTLLYVQLADHVDLHKASSQIKDVLLNHFGKNHSAHHTLFLHPMSRWHLHATFENGISVTSEQLRFVWFYGIIGSFVLLLACINFMNLSTARSEKRAREVGVRKAIGSRRSQLIGQFYSESLLVAAFAFVTSLLLVSLTLPWFNSVAGKSISLPWLSPVFWLACIAFTVVTGLLAGSYPALYLSSFRPVKVLKGTFRTGRLAAVPRKALVVVQFTVSITLIIGTVIIYKQIQFARNRPVGYTRSGLLMFQEVSPESQGKYELMRSELKKTGVVTEVAESGSALTSISQAGGGGYEWKGKDPTMHAEFKTLIVTHEYGKTVGWQFSGGRDFSRAFTSDSTACVINEAAVKYMGLKDPVGETIKWSNTFFGGNYKILGVVKDMVMESPFQPAYPSIFFLHANREWLLVRIDPSASMHKALPQITAVFKKLLPSMPFDYQFADDEYARKFEAEERIGQLAAVFAVLAILISCLGIFGLAAFVAEQRTKEIGIRKVMGASVLQLWSLLSRDFVTLVLTACLISAPLSWYLLHEWLQRYAYRTGLPWWIFAAAGAGALLITLLTVSYQSIRAALLNPVKSLRTE